MYSRTLPVALVGGLIASGAYYAYREPGSRLTKVDLADSPVSGYSQQYSTSSAYSAAGAAASDAGQATRKALVIEQGQIYTGEFQGEGPISKSSDDYGRKILEMVTPEQATARLRRMEESYFVSRGKGVLRYDVVQLPSNDPIEDDHAEKVVEVPSSITPPAEGAASNDWMFWGVFDGHSGWTTSAKLRQALISYVARELNTTYSAASKTPAAPIPTPSSIDEAIKRGFVALDTSIVHNSVQEVLKAQSKAKAASILAPALSGSCALLSFYDSASKTLRVACTGDSRAVLGRRSPSDGTKWMAMPLSEDQTGATKSEAERLRAEHPGEQYVVHNGRVLGGLEPTRAFGDASYKWSKEILDRLKRDFFGPSHRPAFKTPPYVTAEPVVTTTKVQPEKGDFVVMATDGLWEMLTNEEVVGLVGQWLEKNPGALTNSARAAAASTQNDERAKSWLSSWFASGNQQKPVGGLPVQQDLSQADQSGQRAPIRQQQWGVQDATKSRFVVQDKNVATHLIRNALGGKDQDMLCALLTLPSGYSRRYRDDLTVEVIFFGEEDGAEGRVVVNEEATSKVTDDLKSKL